MWQHRAAGPAAIVALSAGLVAVWQAGAVAAADPAATAEVAGSEPLERLGDPPGTPAKPRPLQPRSQPVRFESFSSIQVNVDGNGANILGDAANEPSIAVDPTQPNHIAIGWRQFDTVTSNFRQAGYGYSRDGGRTWTFPGVLDPGVFRSDPVLGHAADGTPFYSSLKVFETTFDVDIFRSTNGGMTWDTGVYAWGGDKQWFTIDRGGGIGHGNVYQAWSTAAGCCGEITFTRSTDNGNTYNVPTAIPSTPIWGTLDVAPDGDLWVAGIDPGPKTFLVSCSQDAQEENSPPIFFTTGIDMGGFLGILGGPTTPNPAGLLGQVWIAVDPSTGPTAGWIYVVASVVPQGPDPLDVHFVRSTDGGFSWSAPVRLNDDASTNNWQWFATLSVAPTGRIDVVWNDTRNTGAANLSQLFYTSSADGGSNWTTNQQLSPTFDSHVGWPNQDKIGDYYHMVSDAVGAHLAWAATFNGEQDVYYSRIGPYDCNSNGVADSVDIANLDSPDLNHNGIPDECEEDFTTSDVDVVPVSWALLQNAPNPFNPSTRIRFDVPEPGGHAVLQIYDSRGREVCTLLDSDVGPGRNEVVWDGIDANGVAQPSGIYLYRLEAAGVQDARRMVLLR